MKPILEAIEFFHAMRTQMRFGELSRLPIHVSRIEIAEESAQCDWIMRPPDPWDTSLSRRKQQENMTEQALLDALKIRELIFRGFPQVQRAGLRMYREQDGSAAELMMIGDVERETHGLREVASLVMRAQLYGFRFSLTSGVLDRISPGERSAGLHASS